MQKTCYMCQSRTATCNLFKTNSMLSLQKVEPSSTLWSCCNPKKGCETSCKLKRACYTLQPLKTFLATPMQHKLKGKLHLVTLAVALDSTLAVALDSSFCNDYRDFWNHCKLQLETGTCLFFKHSKLQHENATCDMSLATCNGFFSNVVRQVARKIASCNTSCGALFYFL